MTNRNSNLVHQNSHRSSSSRNSSSDWYDLLCRFAPVALTLKAYSFFIMCWDLTYWAFYTILTLFRTITQLIRSPPLKSLEGEIALVVGSSRGVGREISMQLSYLGATVICLDINESANLDVIEKIKENGGRGSCFGFTCDVTKKDKLEIVVKEIEETIGSVTMLFHCCGVPSPRSLIEGSPSIQNTMDVCIVSHFHLLDLIVPMMKKQEHGHIVLLTSVAGLSGIKHQMPLSVSQFAVQGIFESLSEELRIARYHELIKTTIVHIYPFIVSDDLEKDIRLRIPSYFGRIRAQDAAKKILEGVRRNFIEISIPSYLLYIGHAIRLLPRHSIFMLRELLDTGVDFG